MFTTPATASEPYTAEAPPVSTSMRSMNCAGMVFMSTAIEPGLPDTKRRPSTSTSVRSMPRLRRSTVETPPPEVRKLEFVRLSVGVPKVGFLSSSSCVLRMPVAAMSSEEMVCTGDGESRLVLTMREPVTTTSCIGSF